jgi:hypothetical protein
MQIPIEIRDNKDVAGSETFDTFVKIEFIEMPEMIPADLTPEVGQIKSVV